MALLGAGAVLASLSAACGDEGAEYVEPHGSLSVAIEDEYTGDPDKFVAATVYSEKSFLGTASPLEMPRSWKSGVFKRFDHRLGYHPRSISVAPGCEVVLHTSSDGSDSNHEHHINKHRSNHQVVDRDIKKHHWNSATFYCDHHHRHDWVAELNFGQGPYFRVYETENAEGGYFDLPSDVRGREVDNVDFNVTEYPNSYAVIIPYFGDSDEAAIAAAARGGSSVSSRVTRLLAQRSGSRSCSPRRKCYDTRTDCTMGYFDNWTSRTYSACRDELSRNMGGALPFDQGSFCTAYGRCIPIEDLSPQGL